MYFTDVVVTVAKGGSMTKDLFKYYLENIIKYRPGAVFGTKCLLLVDSATSHDVEVNNDANVIICKVC